MLKLIAIGGVFIIVIAAVAFIQFSVREPTMPPASEATRGEFRPAPDFALADYEDTTVRLAAFRGQAVVVNSWAAWCPFCREELKDFAAAQEEFGDRVAIIAVDRAESLAVAKRYTDDLGVTGRLIFLLDPADSFYRSIGGFSMPETIFVDREGRVRLHKRGPMQLPEIRERIGELLAS